MGAGTAGGAGDGGEWGCGGWKWKSLSRLQNCVMKFFLIKNQMKKKKKKERKSFCGEFYEPHCGVYMDLQCAPEPHP